MPDPGKILLFIIIFKIRNKISNMNFYFFPCDGFGVLVGSGGLFVIF